MKKTDLAYIAGIIDGEGCIAYSRAYSRHKKDRKVYYYPDVSVGMANEYLVKWLHFNFQGSIQVREKSSEISKKPIWVWRVRGEIAIAFLEVIYPYLIIKKPQADILLRVWKTRVPYKYLTPVDRYLQEFNAEELRKTRKIG